VNSGIVVKCGREKRKAGDNTNLIMEMGRAWGGEGRGESDTHIDIPNDPLQM